MKKPKTIFVATIDKVTICDQKINDKKKRTLYLPKGMDGVKYKDWRDSLASSIKILT